MSVSFTDFDKYDMKLELIGTGKDGNEHSMWIFPASLFGM